MRALAKGRKERSRRRRQSSSEQRERADDSLIQKGGSEEGLARSSDGRALKGERDSVEGG